MTLTGRYCICEGAARIIDFEEENKMSIIEVMELVRHRSEIAADVRSLVEKYRAIFSLDTPEFEENAANKLILAEIHTALKHIEKELLG